jgi:hypothetical protein
VRFRALCKEITASLGTPNPPHPSRDSRTEHEPRHPGFHRVDLPPSDGPDRLARPRARMGTPRRKRRGGCHVLNLPSTFSMSLMTAIGLVSADVLHRGRVSIIGWRMSSEHCFGGLTRLSRRHPFRGDLSVFHTDSKQTSTTYVVIDILLRLKTQESHRQSRTAGGCVGSFRFAHRRVLAMPRGRYSYPHHVGSRRFLGGSGVRRRSRRYVCLASVPDVSRWGYQRASVGDSEVVRLSRCGRGRAASDG